MEDFIAYAFDQNDSASIQNGHIQDNRIIRIQLFTKDRILGSYFSCIYHGKLRIHIVFYEDTDKYNTELTQLVKETMEQTNIHCGKMWIGDQDTKIVEYMQQEFQIVYDAEPFRYESHELVMPRQKFHYKYDDATMTIRPYEENHIDEYLRLLCNAMSFKIPPYDYFARKEELMKEFQEMKQTGNFEAFWINNDLVGLYWICGTEIDHIVVSNQFQHKGYAKQILTRAMEVLFQNPEVECAWLLVVEWNSKAFNFYRKFGMEEKAVYHVPYKDTL